MISIIFILTFNTFFSYSFVIDEDNYCQSLCLSSLTQNDCEKKNQFIVPNITLNGCCPGCRGGIVHGQCDENNKCAFGLKCIGNICYLDKSTCAYTYHLKNYRQIPTCETDGTFAAVQCKGDKATGRCFCYSKTGERIYGWAWWRDIKKDNGMNCACSRLKHKLNLEGQYNNTLHCDQKGNFEPLQCNNGICWCANIKTGELVRGTRAVPSTMWNFLPCYVIDNMGQKYLRQCESAANAQHHIKKILAIHGTTNIEFNNVQCDFDGSYGSYAVSDNMANCQWKDGTRIAPYATTSNLISKMNCNCARDKKIFDEERLQHILHCNGNGNYESIQDVNGKSFCIDRDGYAVTDTFNENNSNEEQQQPSCNQYLYYQAVRPSTN